MKYVLMVLCVVPFLNAGETNGWVIPWVANRSGQWSTRLVLTNSEPETIHYNLMAYRSGGESQEIQGTVDANETKVLDAGAIFDQLGSGTGYTVYLSSQSSRLRAEYLLTSLSLGKEGSPACGTALPINSKQYQLSIDALTNNSSLFSAVVVVNPNDGEQEVSWQAFPANETGALKAKNAIILKPWEPTVIALEDLFLDAQGMLRLELEGEFPILATGFVFSQDREPTIVEAQERFALPDDVRALRDSDFPEANLAKAALGKFLYWDKIISGNMNISCGSCHHTMAGTGDGLSLPIGEGGNGIGIARDTGGEMSPVVERVPRNAPAVFNLGAKDFITFFHDGRVFKNPDHPKGFDSPAGDDLLPGLESGLAAQAMFPPTSPTEMKGQMSENDAADSASDLETWELLTARVMGIEAYQTMFREAFPEINVPEDVTFAHIANAIGSYEGVSFRADQTPFDEFLRGNNSALSWDQKRGMALFYGKANCGECHAGPLMTDQDFHALGIPPIGPGKGDGFGGHDDFGREQVTADREDRYRFRTPPLRNVALTGPWGHNGSFDTLEAMVRHNLNPVDSLDHYDVNQVVLPSRADLNAIDFMVLNDAESMAALKAGVTIEPKDLTEGEISDVMAFLKGLTDPDSVDMRANFPRTVPSGLPVFD